MDMTLQRYNEMSAQSDLTDQNRVSSQALLPALAPHGAENACRASYPSRLLTQARVPRAAMPAEPSRPRSACSRSGTSRSSEPSSAPVCAARRAQSCCLAAAPPPPRVSSGSVWADRGPLHPSQARAGAVPVEGRGRGPAAVRGGFRVPLGAFFWRREPTSLRGLTAGHPRRSPLTARRARRASAGERARHHHAPQPPQPPHEGAPALLTLTRPPGSSAPGSRPFRA